MKTEHKPNPATNPSSVEGSTNATSKDDYGNPRLRAKWDAAIIAERGVRGWVTLGLQWKCVTCDWESDSFDLDPECVYGAKKHKRENPTHEVSIDRHQEVVL